jgi:hypothetical protein
VAAQYAPEVADREVRGVDDEVGAVAQRGQQLALLADAVGDRDDRAPADGGGASP